MTMAELSTVSTVAAAIIKFYLGENLLPAGKRAAPNQADYDERHLRREGFIRGLLDVGGLPVADAHRVLDALDSDLRPAPRGPRTRLRPVLPTRH